MSVTHGVKEFIYIYLRDFINIFFPWWNKVPFVIGEIIFVSHLFVEMERLITFDLNLFRYKKSLPPKLGVGLSERIVEIPWAISHLPSKGNHLDAGASFNFRTILLSHQLRNLKIFIVNLNPEKNCYVDKYISYIFGDLRKKIFTDGFFDSISCVSVLEHVGMDNSIYIPDGGYKQKNKKDYLLVVKEFKRILIKKGICLITIPFGAYEDHDWYQVFDTAMVRELIKAFDPSSFDISYYQYNESGWQLSTEKECSHVRYSQKHIEKSYCAASRAVACIKLVK
ncbi:MAG: hypothetical protein AAB557_03265 [Patescibacteria group bacterium]